MPVKGMVASLIRENGHLMGWLYIPQGALHGEAIHLGFRKRIGSPEFNRVLGRHHEKKPTQLILLPIHRDLPLRHGLKQRALRAGRSPVDLISKENIREYRSGQETKLLVLLVKNRNSEDVGRKKIGSEL